ncbi:YraN family protein [Opitutus sp. GAS368]|uniref:YraN family protein n=1 Tax=Opitutus sp. GAS368 TaxID=1882749 RepID=UPI00087AC087|nr:YraN family protein [Opitutus sp. GAS368]SDR65495.1 putative endonuclease [Opitutus sp. GAS368]
MLGWLKEVWSKVVRRRAPTARAEAGARGEQAAADYLQERHGFAIVTRNWRSPRDRRDEIDLVCRDGEVLVFVEVKARAEGARVAGFSAVDERKKRALRRAVHAYLAALASPPRTFRFDVAEVTLSDRLPAQVMHFENAPLFPKGYHVARQSGSLDEMAGG